MKEGWEYKKLGDVCNIYQPKTLSSKELVEDGKYLVYGANGVIGKYNSYNHESSEVLMTCRGATCGTINVSKPHSWINGNAMVVHPQQNNLSRDFLFYLLKGLDLSDVITGAAQPQITRQSLAPKKIGIPPLSEQQHIVEELDLLSSIIEKKKAQLNELDNMAQSLFYEMFGDPITNEKGWEKKCLSELCGRVNNIRWQEVLDEKTYNYVDLTAVDRTSHCIEETTMIKKGDAPSRAKQIIRTNDVLFGTTRPTLKRVCLVNKEYNDSICSTGFCVLRPLEDFVSSKWLFHLLLSNSFYSYIEPLQSGASYPAVSDNIVKSFNACIPPIILQNQFASKIEAVEHQKELIKQSIKEVETLFNSRMDYYFN